MESRRSFVRLPFYKSPPNMYDEGFYRSLAPLLDAEGLTFDPHYYGDEGHFNRYGTDLVSPWLDKAIQPYLGPLKDERFFQVIPRRPKRTADPSASLRMTGGPSLGGEINPAWSLMSDV